MLRSPDYIRHLLRGLLDEGVTPTQIATALFDACSEDDRTTDAERERARARYAVPSNGTIEIDDNAMASRADDGLWVQAWLWLPDEESAS